MPFTLAHTVAAPPLWRGSGGRLILSAVVIGSVAPDLEYLAHLNTERTIGHDLLGVFVLDLPLALALLALWHGLVKLPVAALFSPKLLPPIDIRPFPWRPGRRFVLVCGSVLAGVATHLLWDSFTHRGGFITRRVDLLTEAIGRPHVYDLLNYASTLAGMVILGWWWWQATARTTALGRPPVENVRASPLPDRVRRPAVAAIVIVTAAGGAANGLRLRIDGWGIETTVVGSALGAMAAGLLAVLVASVLLRLLLGPQLEPGPNIRG